MKGQATGMVHNSDVGAWGFVAKRWQASHRLMMFLAS
jgi:hypothetical protein